MRIYCIKFLKMEHKIQAFIFLLEIAISFISCEELTCGYKSCPKTKDGYLNVHLVPHSHMDMGWLQTVDQYYQGDGENASISVKQIFESVVHELQHDERRRFIDVEIGFFSRWWIEQNETLKDTVKHLVNSGQLEFIQGGWVMNDEAGAHYTAVIDQLTLGLRFLNDTFGKCGIPRVAWQIDPFGHSQEQASIYAQMGYDGLFIGRIDYQDKNRRKETQEMEMIWKSSPKNFGKSSELFTGVLYNNYDPPDGFCYDRFCSDLNQITNWDKEAEKFIAIVQQWAKSYKTNHLLMPMGSDFHYTDAGSWFNNLDLLIKHINHVQKRNASKINLLYSTPSCYLQEVHRTNTSFPLKTDDFFPYASKASAVWSGYFTSRPTFKYYIAKSNNFLQACKQLAVEIKDDAERDLIIKDVQVLAESVAVVQHHDAVSGTAQQHVTDDYSKSLSIGIKSCENVIRKAYRSFYGEVREENDQTQYEFCQHLNISMCEATESKDKFVVSIYNPLARTVKNSFIRIPVITSLWMVEGNEGVMNYDAVPIPESVRNIPERNSKAQYEIVFLAKELKGLTVSFYTFTKVSISEGNRISQDDGEYSSHETDDDFRVENSVGLSVVFDSKTGLLKSLQRGNEYLDITQNFFYYEAIDGMRQATFQSSGAYVFRPTQEYPQPVANSPNLITYKVFKGQHVTEVHQIFSNWTSQIVRVYDTSNAVEFEWLIGPIPVKDWIGKEVVTRYTTNISSNGQFFTDSNGRELHKRKRDSRPTWDYEVNEKVAGNYYPVNSRIILSETEELSSNGKTLVILNDRTQGGSSINDGEIEIMLHRRLLMDDGFGLSEPLDERAFHKGLIARGKHWLVFAGLNSGINNSIHRSMAQEIFMDKIIGIRGLDETEILMKPYKTTFSKLNNILPPNVHLLTLEPLQNHLLLLRLEHIYETDEDEMYSHIVKIMVKELKRAFPNIQSIRETTLSANRWLNEASRLKWVLDFEDFKMTNNNTDDNEKSNSPATGVRYLKDSDEILLKPMEIKTFLLHL